MPEAGDREPGMSFDDDLTACAALVERGDPGRFAATMAAPVAARPALFAIYAFNVEVTRAPRVTAEPMIAGMRLQWWRDALAEIAAGGPVRRHEVATPLSRVLDARGAALLDDLVVARWRDCEAAPFEDTAQLLDYLDKTSAHLLLAAARALGDVPEGPVRAAGLALGVANWLRAVPALRAAGHRPLPEDDAEAVRGLAREGLARLAEARARRAGIPTAVRPAMLAVWQAAPVLRCAARRPGDVAAGRLELAPARARVTLMLRAASGRW